MRYGGGRVRSGSLGSLGCALVVDRFVLGRRVAPCGLSGASVVAAFIMIRPWGCRVRPGSLGSFGSTLRVVGFVRCHLVDYGSSG